MKVVFNPGNLKRPELANTRKNSLTFFRENLVQIGLSVGDLLGLFSFLFLSFLFFLSFSFLFFFPTFPCLIVIIFVVGA